MWVKGEYHTNFDSVEAIARGTTTIASTPNASAIAAPATDLFERIGWFRLLHVHCMPQKSLLIPRTITAGQSMLLPLVQDGPSHFSSLSNYYSFHFRPLVSGTDSPDTLLPLVIAMARRLKKQAASITLSPLPDADGTSELMETAFCRAGWVAIKNMATIKHSLSLNGRDFDAYWAGRPGELRNTVARKAKKNIVSIKIFDTFDAQAWDAYEDIYANSWKTAEGVPEFLRALAQAKGAAGRLRLGMAYIEGRPVAAQFWTVDTKSAYIHKLAHVEDTDKASPGTLLSAALFRHVIDIDRVQTIDFGTGDDAYKPAWMENRETLSRLVLLNPSHPSAWWPIAKHALRRLAGR
jgi:hypothetical protein